MILCLFVWLLVLLFSSLFSFWGLFLHFFLPSNWLVSAALLPCSLAALFYLFILVDLPFPPTVSLLFLSNSPFSLFLLLPSFSAVYSPLPLPFSFFPPPSSSSFSLFLLFLLLLLLLFLVVVVVLFCPTLSSPVLFCPTLPHHCLVLFIPFLSCSHALLSSCWVGLVWFVCCCLFVCLFVCLFGLGWVGFENGEETRSTQEV